MSSANTIERIKSRYGTNLEHLAIEDRYAAIALLAIAVNRQRFIFQILAEDQSLLGLYQDKSLNELIYDVHVAAIPGVIKFLSETIPGSL